MLKRYNSMFSFAKLSKLATESKQSMNNLVSNPNHTNLTRIRTSESKPAIRTSVPLTGGLASGWKCTMRGRMLCYHVGIMSEWYVYIFSLVQIYAVYFQ